MVVGFEKGGWGSEGGAMGRCFKARGSINPPEFSISRLESPEIKISIIANCIYIETQPNNYSL